MKFLMTFLMLLFTTKECNDNSKTDSAQTDSITITYQATSRGSFQEVSVSKNSFTLCNDLERKEKSTFNNTEAHWKECLDLLSKIDIEELPDIEAPTSMRHYDGAPHALIIIKNGSEEIRSSTFDHGHPPAKIKTLVEKLLSFKKIASKE